MTKAVINVKLTKIVITVMSDNNSNISAGWLK